MRRHRAGYAPISGCGKKQNRFDLSIYNRAMSNICSPLWNIKPATRLDRTDPYLLLQQVTLFVRDQERSLRFFVDCLGFRVALLPARAP